MGSTVLVLAVLLGLIPAAIARGKGYNFFAWWLFGAALFIVALVVAIAMKPNRDGLERRQATELGMKKCPSCAEMVNGEALKCRFCGYDLAVITNIGRRYALGYTAFHYGLWDRAQPLTPVRQYPKSDTGWAIAWQDYQSMEGPTG